MKQEELYRRMVEISDVEDFVLELLPTYSKSYYGRYFPNRKLIRIYALNTYGDFYSDEFLLETALHELSHHIQYYHIPFWKRKAGVMHDDEFWNIFKGMMRKTQPLEIT